MKTDADGRLTCGACRRSPAGLIFTLQAQLETRLTEEDYILLCPACRKQLLRKNILTESIQCVNLSSPARMGQNLNHINNVNTKTLALISGVLSTAFGQIKNILTGDDSGGCTKEPEAPKEKKASKSKPAPEPEPEEEEEEESEEEELTVEVEDEDETDYDALRATMKEMVAEKVKDVKNKDAVRAAMVKVGAKQIKEIPNDKLEPFIALLKKIK